jgi:hypothetical protein
LAAPECGPLVFVSGENWPDGLAAGNTGASIVLTGQASLPAETLAFMDAFDDFCGVWPHFVIGGEAAVSSAVYEAIDTWNGPAPVTRIAGANRFETAIEVAEMGGPCNDVLLATGSDFPDALAAGPLSHEASAPIILNSGNALRADVKSYLASCSGTITIIGGTAVVPKAVADELVGMGKSVERIAGANRAETAAKIALELADDYGYAAASGNVILVNGNGFADALSASGLAVRAGAPIVLVNSDSIPPATAALHVALCNPLDTIWAVGGTAVVSEAVLDGAAAATACAAPALTSASLTNSGYKQAKCELNNNVAGADGVMVTAVPGSAADGAAGNDWTVLVFTTLGSNFADVDPVSKYVSISINLGDPDPLVPGSVGTTQQELVDAWYALGTQATAYFVPSVTTKTGAPSGYDHADGDPGSCVAGGGSAMTAGSQNQTLTVTFNQDVDRTSAPTTGSVLETSNFSNVSAMVVTSPVVATPGGASEYTLVQLGVTDSTDLVKVGDTIATGGGVYSSSSGLEVVAPGDEVKVS